MTKETSGRRRQRPANDNNCWTNKKGEKKGFIQMIGELYRVVDDRKSALFIVYCD